MLSIDEHFKQHSTIVDESFALMKNRIMSAACLMVDCLRNGHKIMSCGNGGSAGDAQHFAAELVNRYERDRPPLAGLSLSTDSSTLTSIANDFDYSEVFAKQVIALGRPGDILLAISTSGNSSNVVEAVKAAHSSGIHVIALTGRCVGVLNNILSCDDVLLCVPSGKTAHIQEIHLVVIHCLCHLIDEMMFPQDQNVLP